MELDLGRFDGPLNPDDPHPNTPKHHTVIDLDKFGLSGEVPRGISEGIARVKADTPDVWELMTMSDPMIKSIIENPFKAAQIVQESLELAAVPGFDGPIGP
jgi:hypothetical protein